MTSPRSSLISVKAKEKLGWVQEMCAEMVAEDLEVAQRHAFLKANGHDVPVSVEN